MTSSWSGTATAAWSRPVWGIAHPTVARLIYLDAFVPGDGQSLHICARPPAAPHQHASTMLAHGAEPDAARYACGRSRLDHSAPPAVSPMKTFHTQPLTTARHATRPSFPRSYIYCTRKTPADTFGPFAKRFKDDPGWRYFEIDASHSPNVTAPEALMALLEKIVA